MLPLLPALILLLLQGSAGSQRLSCGHLPGAIEALHRQMSVSPESRRVADEVFATLLVRSGSKDFSRALLQALDLISEPETETAPTLVVEDESHPITPPHCLGSPQEACYDCRRSRDGPVLIADF